MPWSWVMAIWSSISNKKKPDLGVSKPKVSRFHCVELVVPYEAYDACDAAMYQHGKRYLSVEAPMIPLAECDQKNCRCRFKHHDDRRHGQRRDPFSASGIHTLYSERQNRRLGGDRRLNSAAKVAFS